MEEPFDITWDSGAAKCLMEIYQWYAKHVSEDRAKLIRLEIVSAVQRLATHPEIFPIELSLLDLPYIVRYVRVFDFKVLYTFTGHDVIVAYIHHVKQNPAKMKAHFKR